MLSGFSRIQIFAILWTCSPSGSSVHRDSPGKNSGWVATPFSRGSSQPRDWIQVLSLLHRQASSLPVAPPGRLCSTWQINFIIYEHAGLSLAPGRVLCLNACLPLSFSPHWVSRCRTPCLWFILGHSSSGSLKWCCLLDMAFIHAWCIRGF